jgi:ADP-heptose:LPS heptosyltransferase
MGTDFLKESISHFFYTEVVKPKRVHIIDQQMELLRPLGIEPDWYKEVALKASETARRSVETKLKGLTDYVLINPGGNWPTKIWHASRYGELAGRLMKDGLPVAVTWGPVKNRWCANSSKPPAPESARFPQRSKSSWRCVRKAKLIRRWRHRPNALRSSDGNSRCFDIRSDQQRS